MNRKYLFLELLGAALAVCLALFAAVMLLREDPNQKPHLQILGAGFIFNYRVADVYYGFTAHVVRPVPVGATIEASFEDPGGGPELQASVQVGTATARYGLRSPPVRGVRAGHPYRVSVRVVDRDRITVIWNHTFHVRSQIDDTIVPEKPLVVGPGYHRPAP